MEQTKEPTRNYPAFSLTPWGIWDVLYARRSHRKYLPGDLDDTFPASLEEMSRLALSVRGADEESLRVVTESGLVERIRQRLHKGMQGKINLWLNRSPLCGFIALALPKEDVRGNRPRMLPLAAMAAEDIVLWLTEAGMGTCWLGGINQKEIKESLGLARDIFVPAVIPFGRPKPRVKARDMDNVMYRTISRKRKPLFSIACMERMDHPYVMPVIEEGSFSASGIQDVAGLLSLLGEGGKDESDVPAGLALDACLEAARIAPSAGNAQKWRFVVVREEGTLGELARACGIGGDWRAAIVAAGDTAMGFLYEKMEKPFWMIDVPIALSHMSLMAASMGLAVDMGLRDVDERAVNEATGLSAPFRAVGVMGIR